MTETLNWEEPSLGRRRSSSSTRDQLHAKARRAIECGEKAFSECAREAAGYLAKARELGATQRESAEAIGKSVGWVNTLLKWRDAGFKSDCPFPNAPRVQRAERKKSASRPATSAEQAQARTARANASRARAEAQKAKAEEMKARAEAKKAYHEAKKTRDEFRARFHEFTWGARPPEKKKFHSSDRDLLVKTLGMLGSDQQGERDNAASRAELLRRKLGMTWDELIVPDEK